MVNIPQNNSAADLMPTADMDNAPQYRPGIIFTLAAHDLRARHAGAMLGLIWSLIQPLVMAGILWVVIGFGLRATHMGGVPFIAWLLPSIAAWSFFAEALNAATPVLQEYSFLVKKVRFPVIFLPPAKILAALPAHIVLLGVTAAALASCGITPHSGWLRLPYFTAALLIFTAGCAWLTAALHALARDVGHIVNVALQFGFWLTPIFWSPELIADHRLRFVLGLNPMCYIVEGYRHCLALAQPPAVKLGNAGWFWIATGLALACGLVLFRRLRPHFADTL